MKAVPVACRELDAVLTDADVASVVRALRTAAECLRCDGDDCASSELDETIDLVRDAVVVLMRVRGRLEALQWNRESAELDAELVQRGYVQTAPGVWRAPDGEQGLSQYQALLRVDEAG